jgi:hypothetical protein
MLYQAILRGGVMIKVPHPGPNKVTAPTPQIQPTTPRPSVHQIPVAPTLRTNRTIPLNQWPRVFRVMRIVVHILKLPDRAAGDAQDRWLKKRFGQSIHNQKNARFAKRLATGCACQSRTEILNHKYPFKDSPTKHIE